MRVPRKWDTLVKFYKTTVDNPKISHRVRMQAAQRLSEIYTAYMIQAEKAAARLERVEVRSAVQREPGGAIPAQETLSGTNELSEDERLTSVFSTILNGGKVVSTDADDTAE